MDYQYSIQLGSAKNTKSVNVDNYIKLELSQNIDKLTEFDARNVLDVSSVYNSERQSTSIYRLYGKIQYLSLLNGLKNDYISITDLFLPKKINNKNLFNSFDFYLVKPSISGYTQLNTISGVNQFVRYFDVIGKPNNVELYTAGFSNNVFNDQDIAFNLNIDVDVTDYRDNFNFPLTDLYLYLQYKPSINSSGQTETTFSTKFDISGNTSIVGFTGQTLNIGDRIYGDNIQYINTQFYQSQLQNQEYYIKTPVLSGSTFVNIMWKYEPLIPLKLRYFSDDLSLVNISGTTYDEVISIPDYATNIGNGNYVWRDILDQGFIDPISGIGVDYPFVNKRRYLFSNIILDVIPNLDDSITNMLFTNIKYGDPRLSSILPNSDLANIGKPCA
jgi:hypothetical protein